MKIRRSTKSVLVVLAAVVAVGAVSSAGATSTDRLTGSIDLVCSQGGCNPIDAWTCNQPVNLASVSIDADVPTINGNPYDALKIGNGCSGHIGTVTISTVSEDGIKIGGDPAGDPHDLTIGGTGSTVTCPGIAGPGVHQDGIQVMSGENIDLKDIDVNCTSATNAQLYINGTNPSSLPQDVDFIGGELDPDPTHLHSVTINGSIDSGVMDSTVCPGLMPPYGIGPQAIDPVNLNNTFPASC
jgi:hypothetical protein